MQRSSFVALAALLLWPLAAYANDVDVPELGVRLGTLPDGMTQPQVTQRPAGRLLMHVEARP